MFPQFLLLQHCPHRLRARRAAIGLSVLALFALSLVAGGPAQAETVSSGTPALEQTPLDGASLPLSAGGSMLVNPALAADYAQRSLLAEAWTGPDGNQWRLGLLDGGSTLGKGGLFWDRWNTASAGTDQLSYVWATSLGTALRLGAGIHYRNQFPVQTVPPGTTQPAVSQAWLGSAGLTVRLTDWLQVAGSIRDLPIGGDLSKSLSTLANTGLLVQQGAFLLSGEGLFQSPPGQAGDLMFYGLQGGAVLRLGGVWQVQAAGRVYRSWDRPGWWEAAAGVSAGYAYNGNLFRLGWFRTRSSPAEPPVSHYGLSLVWNFE